MLPQIEKISAQKQHISTAVLFQSFDSLSLSPEIDSGYLKEKLSEETEWTIYKQPAVYFFHKAAEDEELCNRAEAARQAGSKFFDVLKSEKITTLQIVGNSENSATLSFLEGMLLSGYSFSKYKKEKDGFALSHIFVVDQQVSDQQIVELKNVVDSVFRARDLVNEPLSFLTATRFSEEMEKLGNEAGFTVEVFNKKKIEALRMGGLLAVNKGSIDPPTFSILEWNPENAVNDKPVVLVGKGVVFDTGGLSLKPTAKSMDYMKCDMAGGAVVAATIYALAKNKTPLRVVGLVPATDNRPDGNAYVPGDVITMFDGTTVEIRNTDAEGRLLLADALSYAKRFDPMLVIDLATLTGSAEIITGSQALVAMGTSPENLQKLKNAGEEVYERMVEVPLWKEFAKSLKSDIADLNNLGVREAQTSIAGKFLEHFTDYPWLHLDIAGVAFYHEKDFYRPAGGTGFGIRLLYHFLKKFN
ncbi:leucyl aminopeptidase [Mariniphaga anaerophila]|uniref:Leucyl aminopeptidase n=1 Tax=Mariniphaga anaerophila TaxID=1484053 RepID=A0A1M5CUB2_9BACT|nr:leucyl aminopeptidase family protein [Mariniphaga anaerophila]SHF58320.1 leucyl aminopeptidase [Mariniphaga anaerophila]